LENELALARERLALEENEKHSLQMSLELTISEYSRLSSQLADSEYQVEKLEQMYSKLNDNTNTLLKTCKGRDPALARAEERLSLLANLFVQLEAANLPKSQKSIEELNSQLQRELDKDKWLLVETSTVVK
jgi:ABC-type transporter Mla subunit MlaD